MNAKLVAALAAIAVCVPIAAEAASQFDELQSQIDDLQAQINAIVLIPGPQGETGPEGPTGPAGAAGAGGSFELIAHKPGTELTTGIITPEKWDECASELGGRPANSKDVISLPWAAESFALGGWVNPYVVAGSADGGTRVVDISGIVTQVSNMTCTSGAPVVRWNLENASTGLVAVHSTLIQKPCSDTFAIVCVVPSGS